MKKLLAFVLAAVALTGCASNEEPAGANAKTLKVVTVAPYEPYEMMNENGEFEGFDIELGNALAAQLGYQLEWQNLEFDAALLSVQSGDADLAIAGLSPEAERKKVMDFSDVYYQDDADTANTVVTLKDKGYQSIDDLKGKKAGSQNGTIQQAALESIKDEYSLTIDTRKEYADIAQEILNGNLDFMVCEKAMADGLIKAHPEFTSFLLGAGENSEGNAIAFKKGSALKDEFNKALKQMKDSGELQKLIDKWFK